jgi:hypothetical protein
MATTRVILMLTALAAGCDLGGGTGPIGGPTSDGGAAVRFDGGSVIGAPTDAVVAPKLDARFMDSAVPPPLGVDGGPL